MGAGDRDQTLDKRRGRPVRDQMMRQQADRPFRRLDAEAARPQLADQGAERGGLADKAAIAAPRHRIDMHVEGGEAGRHGGSAAKGSRRSR